MSMTVAMTITMMVVMMVAMTVPMTVAMMVQHCITFYQNKFENSPVKNIFLPLCCSTTSLM